MIQERNTKISNDPTLRKEQTDKLGDSSSDNIEGQSIGIDSEEDMEDDFISDEDYIDEED